MMHFAIFGLFRLHTFTFGAIEKIIEIILFLNKFYCDIYVIFHHTLKSHLLQKIFFETFSLKLTNTLHTASQSQWN